MSNQSEFNSIKREYKAKRRKIKAILEDANSDVIKMLMGQHLERLRREKKEAKQAIEKRQRAEERKVFLETMAKENQEQDQSDSDSKKASFVIISTRLGDTGQKCVLLAGYRQETRVCLYVIIIMMRKKLFLRRMRLQ